MKKMSHGLYHLFAAVFMLWVVMSTCSTNNNHSPTMVSKTSEKGSVSTCICIGKVGVLAKCKLIDLQTLSMSIVLRGTQVEVADDTVTLSGHGDSVINQVFTGLDAPNNYTLIAKTRDQTGKIIHSGAVDFSTIPADTTEAALSLDAQYSMLQVSFNNLPDSVGAVVLKIPGEDTLESEFSAGSLDTVILGYDYLAADSSGISHQIVLEAYGIYYGVDTLLYAADTTISIISGVDNAYYVNMEWVGPGTPDGVTLMSVTMGAVGTAVVNSAFELITGVPTEGIITFYPFNGNADDESGNGNNGTMFNLLPVSDRFGADSSAFHFNGTSSYIEIPDSQQLDPSSGMSITLWVNPDTLPPDASFLVCKHTDAVNYDGSWWIALRANGNIDFQATPNFNGSSEIDAPIETHQWTFVGFTYNNADEKWYGYVNGYQIDSGIVNYDIYDNDNNLLIGAEMGMSSVPVHYFEGALDNIRIYDRPLTRDEMKRVYQESN